MKDAYLILKVVVRDKILWACLAGISAASLFGFLVPQPLYGPGLLLQVLRQDYPVYTAMLEDTQTLSLLPEGEADVVAEKVAAEEQGMAAATDQELYEAYLRYDKAWLKEAELFGDSSGNAADFIADSELISSILALDEPEGYDDTSELPAFYVISSVVAYLPPLALVIPGIVTGYLVADICRRSRLLGKETSGRMRSLGARIVALFASGALLPLAYTVPLFAIAFIKNGAGSLSYPVVFTGGGTLHTMTAGTALVETLLLLAMGNAFLACLATSISWALDRPAVGAGAAVILTAISDMPSYYSAGTITAQWAELLPTSYFYPLRITGNVGDFPYVDVTPYSTLSVQAGTATLLASAVLIALLSVAARLCMDRARTGKGVASNA